MSKSKTLKNYHKESNHRGIIENYEHLRRTVYFPNRRSKIQLNINLCEICQTQKYERKPQKIKFEITQTPSQPLENIHFDIYFLEKGQPILTLIVTFSRHAQAYKLKSHQTKTPKIFRNIWTTKTYSIRPRESQNLHRD